MKNWLTRIAMPITVAAAAAGLAAPATAAPPTPNPTGSFYLDDPDVFGHDCPGFRVLAQLTGKSKEIGLSRDRVIAISPATKITLTGPTGKSVTYNITGTSHVQNLAGGGKEIRATGHNLLLVPEVTEGPAPHGEEIFFTTGNVNYALTAKGEEARLFSGPGKAVAVCELLN